jgi:hypothetical protein
MFSRTLERRRKLHQLGIIVAASLFVVGGAVLGLCTLRGLKMLQVAEADGAPIVAGMFISLAALGLLCFVAYYAVRAVGWLISR